MKKIELLQSVALFWDLTEEELGYISEKMISKGYDSGNLIFLEDFPVKSQFEEYRYERLSYAL